MTLSLAIVNAILSLSLSFSLSILHLNMRACYLRVENKSKHSSCWGPHGKLRCICRETCSIRSEEMKVKKVEKNIWRWMADRT